MNLNKSNVRRSDIYMTELKGSCEMLQGLHPVLVLNCKKSMDNSNLISIAPITSKIKNNVCNVPIGVGSGLLQDSIVLCNQVRTIPKSDLQGKVGFASPQLMDSVTRTIAKNFEGKNGDLNLLQREKLDFMFKSIKKMISFKVKYNIIDVEIDQQIQGSLDEIKSYCKVLNVEYKNWGSLDMFKQYQEKRRGIRIARGKKNVKLAAKLSEEYLKSLYEIDNNSYNTEICSELEWAKYNHSLAVKKLGYINKSYELAKQALTFSNEEDNNRILTYWLIGECCSLKGDNFKEEGLEAFDKCIKFYKRIGEKKYEILCQFNKSKLLKDMFGMEKCIQEYEETQFKNVLHSFGDMENEEVLLELQNELNNIKISVA